MEFGNAINQKWQLLEVPMGTTISLR